MSRHIIALGRTSKDIAQSLVTRFGIENIIQNRVGTFPGGEASWNLFINGALDDHPLEQVLSELEKEKIRANLEGAHVTFVHSVSGENNSSRGWSLIHALDSYKDDYGVASISVIATHMNTRGDRPFDGEYNAVTNKSFAKHVRFAGADSVRMIDPHSKDSIQQWRDIFRNDDGLFDHEDQSVFYYTGVEVLAQKLRQTFKTAAKMDQIIIGAPDGANKPDDEGARRAREVNKAFWGYPNLRAMFGIAKKRLDQSKTIIDPDQSDVSRVAGKICVLADDIIEGGSTTRTAAEFLKENGAKKVIAYATHGVFVGDSLQKLLASDSIDEIWVTDTVPGIIEKYQRLKDTNAKGVKKLRILSVAPLVTRMVEADHGARLKTMPDLSFLRSIATAPSPNRY